MADCRLPPKLPMTLPFTKMHGAGNDFVVLDLRNGAPLPEQSVLQRIADRHCGVGCDQIMVLQPARTPGSLAAYQVINGDGSLARQCGNGVRCLGAWLDRAVGLPATAVLDGPTGPVSVRRLDAEAGFEVDLGAPDFTAAAIPLHLDADPDGHYRLAIDGRPVRFGALSMGNPHALITVDDVARAPVALAAGLQAHPAFPEGCNVGFVQVLARDHLALRVIERGVGETLACGSGACAAHAWLRRTGRVDAVTRIDLPGGTLAAAWAGTGDVMRLRGPTTFVFEGTWSP